MKKNAVVAIVIVGMFGGAMFEYVQLKGVEKLENHVVEDSVVESDQIGNQKGDMAIDFELTTLDGETIKLSDYKGQRVMLNFWATWCPPCRAEMPDMQKFQEEKDVKVVAVNLTHTEANLDNVKRFVDEYGLTFTIPLDQESEISKRYQIVAYPTTYMIDSDGRIQFVTMGALNYDRMVQQFEMMR